MMRLVLVMQLLGAAQAWVSKSQSVYGAQISEIQAMLRGENVNRDPRAQLGYLWHMPENPDDTRGLGGGITWAWDPALCTMLAPQFKEDIMWWGNFVNCDNFKAAVSRAFDKWSANHRLVKFIDVSKECEAIGKAYGPPTGERQPPPSGWPANVVWHGGCEFAEVWVTAIDQSSGRRLSRTSREIWPSSEHDSTGRSLSEVVGPLADEEPQSLTVSFPVAQAAQHLKYSYDFRYSNGDRPFFNANSTGSDGLQRGAPDYRRRVVEAVGGTFFFNTNEEQLCWYMDSNFCAPFHDLKRDLGSAENAKLLVEGLTYALMGIGLFFYLCFFMVIICRAFGCNDSAHETHIDDEDGDGQLSCCERINSALRAVSHFNPMVLTIFLMLCILPPLLTTRIFRPCFECYDFEAAALHEIGHFLGLGHPDNIPENWAYPTTAIAGPRAGNNSYNEAINTAVMAGNRPSGVCTDPWADVKAGVPSDAVIDTTRLGRSYPIRDAQMEAFAQHNPRACLTDDDLEALAVLYPDCSPYAMYHNVCNKVQHHIGLVRTGVYIIVPGLLLLLFVVTINSIVHIFEGREKRRMRAAHSAAVKYAQHQKGQAIGNKVIGKFQMAAAKAVHKASRRQRGRTPSTAHRGQDPLAASSGPPGMSSGVPDGMPPI